MLDSAGPLDGLRVLELAGIGPGPFCSMLLGDLGAEVIRVDRPGGHPDAWGRSRVLGRNKRSLELDLKDADAVRAVLDLVAEADALIEGFRPGVTERLGLGPAECLDRNPALVYGRMTGWGQAGPNSDVAGHDINYLAAGGILHAIGREGERPVPPLNLLGDFGGGGLLLAFGVVSAILRARADGKGQVVDAAVVDGVALLGAMISGFRNEGIWRDERGVNLLDGGAPFYDTYVCADGRYVAVGALEPRFFRSLLSHLGLGEDKELSKDHLDRRNWATIRAELTKVFAERTRDEWTSVFAGSDCCVSPVLSLEEAERDGRNRSRGVFCKVGDEAQPSPAPRFSTTPNATPRPGPEVQPQRPPTGKDELDRMLTWARRDQDHVDCSH